MSGRSLLRIIISEGFLHPFSSRYTKGGQQSPRSPRGPSQGWKLLCPWPFRKVAQWLCRKPLTLQGPFRAAARQINSSFRMKACSRSFLVKHHWNKLKIKLWTTSLLDPWANFTIWGLLLDELAPKAIELYESPHGNWCLCKALPRCGSWIIWIIWIIWILEIEWYRNLSGRDGASSQVDVQNSGDASGAGGAMKLVGKLFLDGYFKSTHVIASLFPPDKRLWWWWHGGTMTGTTNKPRIRNFPRISNKESETKTRESETKIRESETKIPRIRNQKPRESETKIQESDTKPCESETENQKLKIADQTPRSGIRNQTSPLIRNQRKRIRHQICHPLWTFCWMRYYRQLILIRDQTRHPLWTQCWKGYCIYLFFPREG